MGIFNQKMYEKYNILTSRRIQNHYVTATYKRVNVEVIKEYLLIDVSDRTNLNIITVSDDGNEDTTIDTDDKSTQSKVKESKVKNNNIELQNDCNDDESYQEDIEDDKKDYEFDDESVEIQLARFMIKEILRVKPDSRVPKDNIKSLQNWAKHIDYMIRLDNRKPRR